MPWAVKFFTSSRLAGSLGMVPVQGVAVHGVVWVSLLQDEEAASTTSHVGSTGRHSRQPGKRTRQFAWAKLSTCTSALGSPPEAKPTITSQQPT